MTDDFRNFDALRIVKLEDGALERPVYYSQTGRQKIRVGDVCVKIGDWLGDKVRVEAVRPDGAIDWQDQIPADCFERIPATSAPYCRRRIHESWAWALSLNGKRRSEREWNDALDLAQKVMSFARLNVDLLVERLHNIGYQFANRTPHVLPDAECDEKILELENRGCHLPIALRAWIMEVGRVDLCGSHPDWPRTAYAGMFEDKDDSEPWGTDPLVVDVNLDALLSSDRVKSSVMIAPDDTTKANYSGGGPIRVSTKKPSFDMVMIGQHGSFTLHSYLQHAFSWGGFPGFRYLPDPPTDMLKLLSNGLVRL